jgi:mannose-6-phosphate isomerase-like protein (cupin superfamily)
MAGYRLATRAVRIPAPDGKLIEELFGLASTGTDAFSLAHMVAPPGWSEPPQTPAFGELTVVVRGRMRVEVGAESVEVAAGQAIWTEPRATVRYSNASDAESEYFAVCIPAFTPERAGR